MKKYDFVRVINISMINHLVSLYEHRAQPVSEHYEKNPHLTGNCDQQKRPRKNKKTKKNPFLISHIFFVYLLLYSH